MNDKAVPEKIHKVAIGMELSTARHVTFWAEPDVAAEFEKFGSLHKWRAFTDKYSLRVNGRFNFDEVVDYIKSFC